MSERPDHARVTRRGLLAGTAVLGGAAGSVAWARAGAEAVDRSDRVEVVGERLRHLRRVIARSDLPSGIRRRYVVKVARTQQALVDQEPATAVHQLVVLKQLVRLYKDADLDDALTQKFCDRLVRLINDAKRAILATIPRTPTGAPSPTGATSPAGPAASPSGSPGSPGPTGPTGPTGSMNPTELPEPTGSSGTGD